METGRKFMVAQNKEQSKRNIKLSIQVSLNGLSFCALSPSDNKILFFRDILFPKKLNPIQILEKIENVYEQEDFLRNENCEVTAVFLNELYSLVPERFYKEENASDYLKFNTKILENDYVAQDHLPEKGMVNVYIPYTNINNFFFEKYGEFEYRHSMTVLVDDLLNRNQDDQQTRMYLNCYPGGYDLIVTKEGSLLLANSFKCKTREDFIYYLLFTVEQLQLDPTTLKLILLGKIAENSDYYQIAYTYIKEIKFLETSFGFIFAGKDEPPKAYQHYTLLKTLQ